MALWAVLEVPRAIQVQPLPKLDSCLAAEVADLVLGEPKLPQGGVLQVSGQGLARGLQFGRCAFSAFSGFLHMPATDSFWQSDGPDSELLVVVLKHADEPMSQQ